MDLVFSFFLRENYNSELEDFLLHVNNIAKKYKLTQKEVFNLFCNKYNLPFDFKEFQELNENKLFIFDINGEKLFKNDTIVFDTKFSGSNYVFAKIKKINQKNFNLTVDFLEKIHKNQHGNGTYDSSTVFPSFDETDEGILIKKRGNQAGDGYYRYNKSNDVLIIKYDSNDIYTDNSYY
jgi:hypothetical protein